MCYICLSAKYVQKIAAQLKNMNIGITLSGGAARGIAHLGVLHALEEMGIQPRQLVGVSAGAIVGALYANGYTSEKILKIVESFRLLNFFRPSFNGMTGFFDMSKLGKILKEHLPHHSFEGLKIPLTISATDVVAGEIVHFNQGELITPILASCCVPLMFSPVHFQGKTFVDGGIIDSMPVQPLQDKCDFIIGVLVNPFVKDEPVKSTPKLLEKCFNLSLHSRARANFHLCDIVIEPLQLKKYNALRVDKARELYEIGYHSAIEMKERILKAVENKEAKVK